jgi:hypothetical protein
VGSFRAATDQHPTSSIQRPCPFPEPQQPPDWVRFVGAGARIGFVFGRRTPRLGFVRRRLLPSADLAQSRHCPVRFVPNPGRLPARTPQVPQGPVRFVPNGEGPGVGGQGPGGLRFVPRHDLGFVRGAWARAPKWVRFAPRRSPKWVRFAPRRPLHHFPRPLAPGPSPNGTKVVRRSVPRRGPGDLGSSPWGVLIGLSIVPRSHGGRSRRSLARTAQTMPLPRGAATPSVGIPVENRQQFRKNRRAAWGRGCRGRPTPATRGSRSRPRT